MHVLIWLTQEPGRISRAARTAIDDPGDDLLLSHVSVWKILDTATSGKLELPDVSHRWVDEQIVARGVTELAIDRPSLSRMSELPLHHRDPFDRLLVAQALVHGLRIVSPDTAFSPYGAPIVW